MYKIVKKKINKYFYLNKLIYYLRLKNKKNKLSYTLLIVSEEKWIKKFIVV